MIARYTTPGLNEETIECMQRLVQANIDSRDSYRSAARQLGSDWNSLKATFERITRERDEQARALQSILWCNFRTASVSRSMSSSLHGVLVNLRATFGDTPSALLDEALQIEEDIRQQYVDVLDIIQGRAIRQLLQEQLEAVLVSNERIRTMNDVCRKSRRQSEKGNDAAP
ncbi:MAG: PA2169 family four-helix-bundle protein [Planctomycetaceae bacterium]